MDSTPQRMSAHWLPRPITSNDPSPLFSSSYLVLDYGTFNTLTMWHILWYVTIGQLLYVVLPKPISFQLMVLKTHSNNHLLLQMLSNPSASHHSGCAYVDQVHHLDHVLTCVKLTAPVNQGSMQYLVSIMMLQIGLPSPSSACTHCKYCHALISLRHSQTLFKKDHQDLFAFISLWMLAACNDIS